LLAAAVTVGLTLSLAAPANAAMPTNPPDDKIVIDVVTANGSGCKPGTREVSVSPDNSAFTVSYSDYTVNTKPHDTTLVRKNCALVLNVHVPQGFTYAVAKADYRGFASLGHGATGLEKASYYFQGDSQTVGAEHPFAGPLEDNWQTTDEAAIGSYVYAPCGATRYFVINTELRLRGLASATGTSMLTMDSTDGSIDTIYQFHWKECPTS
jgi:hypothetical protein